MSCFRKAAQRPDRIRKLVADEIEKWRKVVEFAGASVDSWQIRKTAPHPMDLGKGHTRAISALEGNLRAIWRDE
jgi:hypothetical protein